MSERATGASPDQIEAAIDRTIEGYLPLTFDADEDWRIIRTAEILDCAEYLVPPTHRIVAVDDLRALYDWAFCGGRILTRDESGEYLTHDERGIADRIEALIGDER